MEKTSQLSVGLNVPAPERTCICSLKNPTKPKQTNNNNKTPRKLEKVKNERLSDMLLYKHPV